VQADIAGRVAQALDLAIGSRQQQALEDRPTRNLAAYDAFLKGKAQRALGASPVTLRQAVKLFEQAVALDSTFVGAWAALSESASLFYGQGAPTAESADRAKSAADQAIALDPKNPDGYRALGDYYRRVTVNPSRAVDFYSKGLALAPDDANLLRGLGLAAQSAGKWDQAVEYLRRSLSLDPRSAITADALAQTLLWLRRYDEALEAGDQALAIAPSSLQSLEDKAMILLGRGDLEGARRLLAEPPAGVDLPTFVAFMSTYWDIYWPLSDEQRALVKRLRPSAFDNDGGTWALALAGVYEMEGDMRRAAAYGDSARIAIEQQLTASPEDAQRMVLLGVALAYQGRKAEAIRWGLQAVERVPISKDTQSGTYYLHQLARIYVLSGEADKAIDTLERLLAMPYFLSPEWLRIDPTWESLRGNPRFRKLVGGTG
jgi:tetratricopeptide (TPR) repeat protein